MELQRRPRMDTIITPAAVPSFEEAGPLDKYEELHKDVETLKRVAAESPDDSELKEVLENMQTRLEEARSAMAHGRSAADKPRIPDLTDDEIGKSLNNLPS